MLTNEEFRNKIDNKQDKEFNHTKRSIAYDGEKNYSRPKEEKSILLDVIEKERLSIIVPVDIEPKFYRSNYKSINVSKAIVARARRFKEYYCIKNMTIQELREKELQQMLEHYSAYIESSRKGYLLFVRNYVVVDESLLYELIDHISTTKEQRYRKRTIWKRHKEENHMIDTFNLFQELERITPRQKEHIKQMYEYNKQIYK